MHSVSLEGIKDVVIDSDVITAIKENDKLILMTSLQPSVIDSNFDELENLYHSVLNRLESLDLSFRKLENKVNVINAVVNGK